MLTDAKCRPLVCNGYSSGDFLYFPFASAARSITKAVRPADNNHRLVWFLSLKSLLTMGKQRARSAVVNFAFDFLSIEKNSSGIWEKAMRRVVDAWQPVTLSCCRVLNRGFPSARLEKNCACLMHMFCLFFLKKLCVYLV